MISSPDPALAGRLPELRRVEPLYQTARIARKMATATLSRHLRIACLMSRGGPQNHLVLPAASRRTGGDEKHYWRAAAADIIHSG